MPPPFRRLDLQDFAALLQRFPFTRRINSVHMHHTWRPSHADFKGLETIEGMWRYHTRSQGWSDIAQHITIDPEGMIWIGRNWNWPPASASGHNGNREAGPFMFETIGDFDHGRDRLEGKQYEAVLKLTALLQARFDLGAETLRFHNQMSSKSCPGTAVDYHTVIEDIRRLQSESREILKGLATRDPGERPFGDEALEVNEWLDSFIRNVPDREDPPYAEPMEEEVTESVIAPAASPATGRGRARAPELTPGMLAKLRAHVINLNQGQFSSDGKFGTTAGDVDAIFGEHLIGELESAKARKEKLRILFYAHGGLVSESNALRTAQKQVGWWKRNHVYPIFFVWETGLFETIGQLLFRSSLQIQRIGRRDIWDYTTDPLIESTARALYGPTIWSGMKHSAERASASGGGARYVVERLKAFCDSHGEEIALHAAGHSAGAIFHAHFIPTALEAGTLPFQTVHFLAPAIRVDLFRRQLAKRLGDGIKKLCIFTMRKDFEQADHCAGIYRKSLLYLIYYALEPDRKTPILGLETCLRDDPELQSLFGLSGHGASAGEVIWSVSATETGLRASRARSHGGFDDDPATLNSMVRRIAGKDENDPMIEFPPETDEERKLNGWNDQFDLPEELKPQAPDLSEYRPPSFQPLAFSAAPHPAKPQASAVRRRRALCVGINRYPTAPLAGCVADARSWSDTLVQKGFEQPAMLLDEQATRSAILDSLSQLVASSGPGDVVVFQFAGHGTQLPDVSGDEAGEDTPERDEALCPFDFSKGAFVIDDDVAEIFAKIPDGVNVTCFIDCCHSGTITRFAIGASHPSEGAARDRRARFLQATPAMIENHRRFRRERGLGRTSASRGPEAMKEVLFSACRSSEVAWESGGQGEFTVRATRILRQGTDGMTNREFLEKVLSAFGSTPRQHPELDCAPDANTFGLLQPSTGSPVLPAGRSTGGSPFASGQTASIAQLLRFVASMLEQRG